MATYAELFDILTLNAVGAAELRNRIGIATLITAEKIRSGNDNVVPFDQTAGAHDNRVLWADQVFRSSRGAANEVFGAVLAANAGAGQMTIVNATDAQIQTAVDGVADVFAAVLARPSTV